MMKQKWIAMVLLFTLLISAVGCSAEISDEEKISQRIQTFSKDYNNGDLEGVLRSFDAKTRNTYQAAFNVADALIGGTTGFSASLYDLWGLGIAVVPQDEVLSISILEIAMDSETAATVTVQLGLHDAGEGQKYFSIVKEDGDWFIANLYG